ncbi:hypothetical protein C3E80_08970 [Cronobacter malonaticus]|uniref:Uncharacterized protein n=1 Tax=Cronobacter malonaticus TaxID=413503 RepID=A0A423XY36_9ENTR|nr:hypothetical protein C3E80_08970 [Cronobacter malonaticus]RRA40446.1 hypothetical protein C4882_12865 [Cronobacter malonaticus]
MKSPAFLFSYSIHPLVYSLQWMFCCSALPLVLKFHTFRHADFIFKLLIYVFFIELFHDEIAISMVAFLPLLLENDEARKARREEIRVISGQSGMVSIKRARRHD